MTGALGGTSLKILKPIRRLCGLPGGCEVFLLSGLLGGYPIGAQCVSQAYHDKQLSRQDAEAMLSFINNAGPAFIFGMAGPLFSHPAAGGILWAIQLLSAILTARFFPPTGNPGSLSNGRSMTFPQSIRRAIESLSMICGWIILFRIVLVFLQRWFFWYCSPEIQVLLTGVLELSNGCLDLPKIENESLRFILCSIFLSFGGICITMQSRSVTQGLSLKYYMRGKLLQTVFSLLISITLCTGTWYFLLLAMILLLQPGKTQKKSSIHAPIGV